MVKMGRWQLYLNHENTQTVKTSSIILLMSNVKTGHSKYVLMHNVYIHISI